MVKITVFIHMKNGDSFDFDYEHSSQAQLILDLIEDFNGGGWLVLENVVLKPDEISHFKVKMMI